MHARATVGTLRARLLETVRPLVGSARRLALIDFPNTANVGDSAIYLGELACLSALDLPFPRFICDLRTYDRGALARALGPSGLILFAGGGSLGDVWPAAQELREEIVTSFPDHSIVQFPQTIHFERVDALRRARAALNGHPRITLLVRDRRSLEIARSEFTAPSALCPDSAFALGSIERPVRPTRPRLWLMRTDKESRLGAEVPPSDAVVDWLLEPAMWRRALSYRLMGAVGRRSLARIARPLLMRLYGSLARQRLRRGLELLASGEVVITDRLHGHILCLLMGLPHVLLDNTYGKLSSFWQTWTAEVDTVRWAASPAEAVRLAAELAGAPQGEGAGERARG